MKWIKEEHLMHILYWLSPILGAVISTILLFENSAQDNSFAFFFSYCRKTLFVPEMFSKLTVPNSLMLMTTVSMICESLAHILIFSKKTSIESRAQVYEIRGNRLVCEMRHQRNVVSVLGHFFSFSISLIQVIILAFLWNSHSMNVHTKNIWASLCCFGIKIIITSETHGNILYVQAKQIWGFIKIYSIL